MLCSEFRLQSLKNLLGPLCHCDAKDLCAQAISVTIDDKSGQAVGFGVNQAVTIGDFVQSQGFGSKLNGAVEQLIDERHRQATDR